MPDFEAARMAIDIKALGHGIDVQDLQIAATASARRTTLVTRDMRLFVETGIALVDPWTATARTVRAGDGCGVVGRRHRDRSVTMPA